MSAAVERSARTPKSIDDEIAKAKEKLRRLEEQRRESVRKAAERNERAIVELMRAEKLNEIPVEQWKAAMGALRAALGVTAPAAAPQSGQAGATPA